ncbi:MAG: amino acid permease [Clostridia bacterium]|nr:amino acid permease [Clostridia bacterium]
MDQIKNRTEGNGKTAKYLSAFGAWALAFGCSVGWGAFVMPGTTFLPVAGPIGSALGLGIGAVVMIILANNFHYLMNVYPDGGGTYTYTKKCFGYDQGFLSAWFLILTYIAIIWANATALPLIARTVLGSTFQFGFDYYVAGFHVYMGEILLSIGSLIVAAILCLNRRISQLWQIIFAVLLFCGVVICFSVAVGRGRTHVMIDPAFMPGNAPISSTFTIFALAPWAYVGFESISHSASESKYPLKHAFRIMVIALITAGTAYVLLSLLSVAALPIGSRSWTDYISRLGEYSGVEAQPAFYAASVVMGRYGIILLGTAALGAIFTGLIGNFIAISRLLRTMAEDEMIPKGIGNLNKNNVPRNAIIGVLLISVILPFFGRTAISWIVDVTTVGATIAYAFASAAAYKTAQREGKQSVIVSGAAGVIISLLFALEFLIPNITSVKTLATQSYLILAAWGILGFVVFWMLLKRDRHRRIGRSIVAWVILLGLIIFTSSVWMRQTTNKAVTDFIEPVHNYYSQRMDDVGQEMSSNEKRQSYRFLDKEMGNIYRVLDAASGTQTVLIVMALIILFVIYAKIQKREKEIEIEKALAEETSRAKTSFLSNMSHEIRTPMNAIIGLNNIALRDSNLTQRTRDHLEKIGASAEHLLGLINDILDMSRIESGRMVLKNEEFRLKEIINQVNVIINGQCIDKGLDYECRIEGDMHDFYYGDDMKLKQVLINILGNAVKFTEAPGKVTLIVEQISDSDDNACMLRFIMRDTGIGMDEAYIPKIFESFSQENENAANRYGSTGLGMAITKSFVDMMNGGIEIQSKKGVGSVFTVTVPLRFSDRIAEAEQDAADVDLSAVLDGIRVLIAEDVDANAEILADLLELEGIESERAENGKIAIDMFSDNPAGYYNAILMDVRMPVMDGLFATRVLRELSRADAKTIPVIAMTANVFDEGVERSIEAGMNAHLSKPIEPDKLYKTLAEFVNKNI